MLFLCCGGIEITPPLPTCTWGDSLDIAEDFPKNVNQIGIDSLERNRVWSYMQACKRKNRLSIVSNPEIDGHLLFHPNKGSF